MATLPANPAQSGGTARRSHPDLKVLADWLKEPSVPISWLIDQWMRAGTRVLAYAQFKAGKTTLASNLLRSLADGDPFLEEGAVDLTQLTGNIVLLDFEMNGDQLRDWIRAQNIQRTDRVLICPMRGFTSAFNLFDSSNRAAWAKLLRDANCKFLILDCIGPILSAMDVQESDNSQVGKFLRVIDELLVDAGIENCWLIHHMGHDESRPRGASALRGWCDAEITLSRTGDPATGRRFISAVGRDVSQAKRELHFDKTTQRLRLGAVVTSAGGKSQAGAAVVTLDIMSVLLGSTTALSVASIEAELHKLGRSYADATVRKALREAVAAGQITVTGPKNSRLYAAASHSSRSPGP